MRLSVLAFAASFLVLQSCKKQDRTIPVETKHPEMLSKNLGNAEVKYMQYKAVDVDDDGRNDFIFDVLLVGDALLQRDRWQFYAHSAIGRQLLNDVNDESPILDRLAPITKNYPNYTWHAISAIVLTEKIVTFNGSYWDGKWKNASHQYLPIQLTKNNEIYHGWIEVSFDMAAEKLILHRSALSKEAERDVKAGFEG